MDSILNKLVFQKRWRVVRYVLFWSFIMLDELLSLMGLTLPMEPDITFYVALGLDIAIVLIINYLLLPRLFYKKKYVVFALACIGLVAVNMAVVFGMDFMLYEIDADWQEIYTSVLISFITTSSIYGLAVAIKLGKNAYLFREQSESKERERISTELNYLKQQVNPHFLFNVLNTVYIQSLTDQDAVPNTVMQLSDMMRYQIYEASRNDKVSLVKELEFLRNYLDLERLRRDSLQIEWVVDGYPNGISVEPFLFLPLIENAIKHSADPDSKEAKISASWILTREKIELCVINTIGQSKDEVIGGFGLKNLSKRLELAYPTSHELNIDSKDGKFIASLAISFDEVHHN